MIEDMHNLARAFLAASSDIRSDGSDERRHRLASVCEQHAPGTSVYVLYPQEPGVAALRRQEVQEGQSWRLPFVKVAPNAAYLVPVFKVERTAGGKESKRLNTVKHFRHVAESGGPAAEYFQNACAVLEARRFVAQAGTGVAQNVEDAYGAAVAEIVRAESNRPAQKSNAGGKAPLLLVAIDSAGAVWPGDDARLVDWLLESPQRLSIYGEAEPNRPATAACPLCGGSGPPYSNAVAGAGLNFVNGAFRGSFPDMREDRVWRRFAICSTCADLLYFYRNHVAPDFLDVILGSKALVVPSAEAEPELLAQFAEKYRQSLAGERRALQERQILRWLARNKVPCATVSLVWAEFGQKYENIRGLLTHVLPSRLAQLERDVHDPLNRRSHAFYPQNLEMRRHFDLNLGLAAELLRRPGGKRVEAENKSPRRFAVLQAIGLCVFHGEQLREETPFWHEIVQTAEAYWVELLERDNTGVIFQCNWEGPKRKTAKRPPLTLCGWVRHLYAFLDYLRHEVVKVLPKEDTVYEPTEESLRPLFAEARGLDNPAKRFTFLLGVLYGHLIYVQAEKAQVNVAANALSWLRGGRVRANELPELHGKITSKLMEYHALQVGDYRKYARIHALEAELARQGIQVGDTIDPKDLPDERVLYFLMLGIALSYTFTK